MSPAFIFTKQGVNIMALSKTNQDIELEQEQATNEQISFDDLEFDAEFIDEDEEQETKVFYTISGKVSEYEPTWERYTIQDLDIGDEFEGKPELQVFENEDKSYNALRLRLMDDEEILDIYVNFPKKDYPYVRGINKSFDFYRKCFDFIYGILHWKNEANVVDANGEEVNKFNKVNIENFAKFVDQMSRVGIRITQGNEDSDYDSFIIYKME